MGKRVGRFSWSEMSMSGARGQSVPFRAERIPLSPRTNTLGPYGPQRLPGGGALPLQSGRINNSRRGPLNRSGATNPSVFKRTVNSRAQQAANDDANGSGSPACQQQIIHELRQGREEQRKFWEDIKKMGHLITRLEEENRKLNETTDWCYIHCRNERFEG